MRNAEQGFSLLELAVSLAIMALMAAYSVPRLVEDINEKRANLTAQETQSILDAARSYRQANAKWPGQPGCTTAMDVLRGTSPAMLAGTSKMNKFNQTITTSCTTYTFSLDQATLTDWDSVVANLLPGTTVVDASKAAIKSTIGVPGSEPALNNKLSRVDEGNAQLNRMETNLYMGTHDISEANSIAAANISAQGTISAGGNISGGGVISNGGLQVYGSAQINGNQAVLSSQQVYGNSTVNGTVSTTDLSVFGTAYVQNGASVNLGNIQTEGAGCGRNGDIARTATGRFLSCENSIWTAGGGFTGTYFSSTIHTGSYSGSNNSSQPLYVNVYGGSGNFSVNPCWGNACGNSCYLLGVSSGIMVAHQADNNTNLARQCNISFWVAPNASYSITSTPYGNPYGGTFQMSLFGKPS